MVKKMILSILVSIILLLPNSVSALCSNSEKVRLSSLAKNVSVTYDYVETENGVTFNITFTNLQPELYIKDTSNKNVYYYTANEMTLYGYQANSNYRFDVYGIGECNEKLYSHYVTTPGYNPYYRDAICNGVTGSICQKWVNISYDYDTFVNEVNKLKAKQMVDEEQQVVEEPLGFYDYLIKIFINYYYIILPVIIVTCIIIIIVKLKTKKEDLF